MEEFHGSDGAPTGTAPEDQEAPAPLDAGRLGGFLCQLQRRRFDGMLEISSSGHSAAIGFRDGTPVAFDDPTPGHTLAEQLIERGQLTRAQCNSVLARMTDGLVEDEAVAFFEHAVQLGFLPEDDAKVELSSRIRARMIQLLAWRGCETTLESGTAALLGRREFPQSLGAILYMGVRTFYEEEFLVGVHPDLAHTFVRLTAAPATIAHHFELDDEEFRLLRRIHPEQSLSQLFSDPRVDRVHVLGLVLLMRLSQLCEVSNVPHARQASPRATGKQRDLREDAGEPSLRNRTGSYVGPLPDEPNVSALRGKTGSHVGPLPEGPAAPRNRAGSYAGPLPDERSPAPRGKGGSHVGPLPESPAAPRNRAGSYAGPLPDDRSPSPRGKGGSHVGPLPEAAGGKSLRDKTGSRVGPFPEASVASSLRDKTAAQASTLPEPQQPPPLRAKVGATVGPLPEPYESRSGAGALPDATDSEWPVVRGAAGSSVGPLPDPPAPRPGAKPNVDATQEALLEAAARTARLRRSVPSRRNSKLADPLPGPAADGGSRHTNAAASSKRSPSDTPADSKARHAHASPAAVSGKRSPSGPPVDDKGRHAHASPAAASGKRSPSDTPADSKGRHAHASPAAASAQNSASDLLTQDGSGQIVPDGKPIQPADLRADYAKAHLNELIARRKQQAATASESTIPSARDTARELRDARGLLHSQNYSRAEKLLSALVELEPQNEVFRTYHLWARWRAQPDAGEPFFEELQELAKKLLGQPEHAAFAAYALGHVFFHSKRDDLAEKFFKRAHSVDRTNKDAERHLLILERRKQAAAEGGAGANRKLFGIQLPNSKPKP